MESREEYAARMRRLPQFSWGMRVPIEPQWRPGEGDVAGFVHDEVVRQGHDPRIEGDGGNRVRWMANAWELAQDRADRPPTALDVLALGSLTEPGLNSPGSFRHYDVWIGSRKGAPPGRIMSMVEALCAAASKAWRESGRGAGLHPDNYDADRFEGQVLGVETADDWYLAYEWVHPFADGNGRTGKVLHNWLLGTLADPVLVRDYFGNGNP